MTSKNFIIKNGLTVGTTEVGVIRLNNSVHFGTLAAVNDTIDDRVIPLAGNWRIIII